jgi:hypothetical protein
LQHIRAVLAEFRRAALFLWKKLWEIRFWEACPLATAAGREISFAFRR